MKRLCLFLVFITIQSYAAPKISCDEPEYSFGRVDSINPLEHTFIISNQGDENLVIGRVKGCCGAKVQCSKKIVAPGETSQIYVKLSVKGRHGFQRKMIYVKSNDPDTKYYGLIISGEVYTGIFSKKEIIEFTDLKQDSKQQTSFIVTSLSNITFSVTNVSVDTEYIQTSLSKIKENKYRVDVDTLPPIKKNINISYIKIYTDNKKYPEITVPVRTSVLQDIMVMPAKIRITKTPFYKSFVVRSKTAKQFKILNIDMPVDGMSYKVSPLRTASYRLIIKGAVPLEKLKDKIIIIKTDAVENPEVEINLL